MDKALKSSREVIIRVLGRVLAESGRPVPDMADDASLSDALKLDSLDLAVTVVNLEQELGVDPFRNGASSAVRTLGDLVKLYDAQLG